MSLRALAANYGARLDPVLMKCEIKTGSSRATQFIARSATSVGTLLKSIILWDLACPEKMDAIIELINIE